MGLLQYGHFFQGQGEIEQLEMQFRQPDTIPLQISVDVFLHVAAQRFIKKKGGNKENKGKGDRNTDNPAQCPGILQFFHPGCSSYTFRHLSAPDKKVDVQSSYGQ